MISIHHMADRPGAEKPLSEADVKRLEQQGVSSERFLGLKDEAAACEFIEQAEQIAETSSLLLDVHSVPWFSSLELGALLEVKQGLS